jgi:hypothetical protein
MACLKSAILSKANLSAAYLSRANLSGAYLDGAYLSDANLSDADLSGANLIVADLIGAYLIRADLSGANMRDTDLSSADLSEANLRGARLSEETEFSTPQLDKVKTLHGATMINGIVYDPAVHKEIAELRDEGGSEYTPPESIVAFSGAPEQQEGRLGEDGAGDGRQVHENQQGHERNESVVEEVGFLEVDSEEEGDLLGEAAVE